MVFGFKKLDVWKMSIELANHVVKIVEPLSTTYQFTIGNQIIRSSVSVSSNIAEGVSRESRLETARFLNISYASLMECSSQLCIIKESLSDSVPLIKGSIYNADCLIEKIAPKLLGLTKYYKEKAQNEGQRPD